MNIPLRSSWLASMEVDGETLTITTKSGEVLRYTGVPSHVSQALPLANSPGGIWRAMIKGRYQEQKIT